MLAALPVRTTRHRLPIAMGVSTLFVAAILTLDVDWLLDQRQVTPVQPLDLTVDIRQPMPFRPVEPEQQIETNEPIVPLPARELVPIQELEIRATERSGYAPPSPVSVEHARDWDAIANTFAQQHVEDLLERHDARLAMWQRSRSVVFTPEHDFGAAEEAQLLADLDFIEPAGVLGIGFTFGSCFIGLPIAGIPVEERSPAVRLFYCRG